MMADAQDSDVTHLLLAWRGGDQAALARLMPMVYQELHRLARIRLRSEAADHTLQATALVNEAYLRLVDLKRMPLHNRTHFFAMAARLMREVLVDHARRKYAQKRGGRATLVSLDDVVPQTPLGSAERSEQGKVVEILALNEALADLTALDERLCRVVELRFFAGLSIEETAEALEVSTATVERDWTMAKAWLHQRLSAKP